MCAFSVLSRLISNSFVKKRNSSRVSSFLLRTICVKSLTFYLSGLCNPFIMPEKLGDVCSSPTAGTLLVPHLSELLPRFQSASGSVRTNLIGDLEADSRRKVLLNKVNAPDLRQYVTFRQADTIFVMAYRLHSL